MPILKKSIYQNALTIFNSTVPTDPNTHNTVGICHAIRKALQQVAPGYNIKPNYIPRVFGFEAPSAQRWVEHFWWPLTDTVSRRNYLTSLINSTSATATVDQDKLEFWNGKK